jgi:AIPR protein
MKYRIPALAERTRSLKDPNNEKIRIVHAFINVNDLPLDIPLDPDPRAPKITGAVPKRIVASLVSNDGKFHLKNRGITISAKHCEFDNKKNELAVVIPHDEDQFGILDGAHTYECIRSAISEERSRIAKNKNGKDHSTNEELRVFPNQFVHLEILEKIEDDLADIAEARNFSVQLKAWTLANYRDKFDWLLEALGKNFAKNIRVSENDEQPVGILDVIQVISAVNPCLFAQEKPAQDAYKNAGKMLQAFVDDDDRHGFKKLAPICKDIMRLHDHVRLNFKSKYNAPDETGKFGKFGKTKEAQDARGRRNFRSKATYYFLKSESVVGDDPIDKGLSIPLISGFRVLLVEKNGRFEWLTDPFDFFDKNGSRLIRSLMNASDSNDGDPHSVGRDPLVYQQLTSEVRRWYLESQFEKKSAGTLL